MFLYPTSNHFYFHYIYGTGNGEDRFSMIYHAPFTGTMGPLGLAFLTSLQSQSVNYFNFDLNQLQSVVSTLQVKFSEHHLIFNFVKWGFWLFTCVLSIVSNLSGVKKQRNFHFQPENSKNACK